MRIRILVSRDYTPPENRRVTVSYRAGYELTVKREWGEALVADGSAEEMDAPSRPAPGDKPQLDHDHDGKPGGSLPKAKAKA